MFCRSSRSECLPRYAQIPEKLHIIGNPVPIRFPGILFPHLPKRKTGYQSVPGTYGIANTAVQPAAGRCPPDIGILWFESLQETKKSQTPAWASGFLVRRKGLATLWCRRRPASGGPMSPGHRHPLVRVPSRNAKKPDTRMGIWLPGTPKGTRTPDLLIRSQSLYPTELSAHVRCI